MRVTLNAVRTQSTLRAAQAEFVKAYLAECRIGQFESASWIVI